MSKLVRYIYEEVANEENGGLNMHAKKPFGCIVFISKDEYGVSICNPNDQFAKKTGRKIATGRAQASLKYGRPHLGPLPRGQVNTSDGLRQIAPYILDRINQVQEHAIKYFKSDISITRRASTS